MFSNIFPTTLEMPWSSVSWKHGVDSQANWLSGQDVQYLKMSLIFRDHRLGRLQANISWASAHVLWTANGLSDVLTFSLPSKQGRHVN